MDVCMKQDLSSSEYGLLEDLRRGTDIGNIAMAGITLSYVSLVGCGVKWRNILAVMMMSDELGHFRRRLPWLDNGFGGCLRGMTGRG